MTDVASFSIAQIVLIIAFELMAIAAVRLARRLWRGEPTPFVGMQVDFVRSLPFVIVAGVAYINLLLLIALFGSTERATAVGVVGVVLVLPLTVVVPVMATTLWRRGWPVALVPPQLRDSSGRATYRPEADRRSR
jgi:hypothetical protein